METIIDQALLLVVGHDFHPFKLMNNGLQVWSQLDLLGDLLLDDIDELLIGRNILELHREYLLEHFSH